MIALDPVVYRATLALAGLVLLLAAWTPMYTRHRPLSLPMILVAAGAFIFSMPGMPAVDPREHLALTEHLTEFGVIVALMGAGLKLDRRMGLRRWELTWRLLGVSMILTIAGTAFVGWWLAGLAPAAALLLGAVLAPTDPVLAADVQVGEPTVQSEDNGAEPQATPEDDVRFALTSEAGLNDGLAFPFVFAAIAAAAHQHWGDWGRAWLLEDVVVRVGVGVAVGWCVGRLLGRAAFKPPARLRALAGAQDGFVAVAATLLAYGVAELAHGYGFLAVFVAAVALRDSERGHRFHAVLHDFAGQVEQLVVTALLILLGGAAVTGLLGGLTFAGAMVAVAVILIIRPVAAQLGLVGAPTAAREKRAISFFGIRGIGSIYYLAFALGRADFEQADQLWALVVFTILLSIVVHGVTATPVMEHLDRRRSRRSAADRRRETATSRDPGRALS